MKKLIFSGVLAASVLMMTGCSEENTFQQQPAGDGNVTFTVSLPAELGSRAIADGLTADKLEYAVYDADDNSLVTSDSKSFEGSLNTTVSLTLANGKAYKIAFFAHNDNGAYTFSAANQTVAVDYYKVGEYNKIDNDCFYKLHETGKVTGPINQDVVLTRPVAQINWGTNDLNEGAVTADNNYGASAAKLTSKVEIKGAYRVLNLITGERSEEVNITFGYQARPDGETFPVSNYEYLSMNYILVPTETSIVEATLTPNNQAQDNTPVVVSNLPVQANYRTNIYGALLTVPGDFNVTKNPNYTEPDNNINMNDAVVELNENGIFVCTKPALPKGVTEADLEGKGGVALDADGKPIFFNATGEAINTAMQQASEIFLAPNVAISTQSHHMVVPQKGITVHGNGATISGGEQDFSVQGTYSGTLDINLNNLNGVKVWGSVKGSCTMNINLKNCTMKANGLNDGSHSFIMTRGADADNAIININLENCHMSNSQLGIHSTYSGVIALNKCTFTDVVMGVNYAKKLTGSTAEVKVTNCTFTNCGVASTETGNSAYNYAAPVRVVDNGGAAKSVKLTVDNCSFSGTTSDWDVLLMDYRDGKTWYPIDYTITNCTPETLKVRAE